VRALIWILVVLFCLCLCVCVGRGKAGRKERALHGAADCFTSLVESFDLPVGRLSIFAVLCDSTAFT
jgi:hypothetical protein